MIPNQDPDPNRAPVVGVRLDDGWRACVDPAWLEGWSPRTFDLGDGTTELVTMGAGPPLVLIPPLPGYMEAWLAAAAPLARTHRVITFSLRGRFDTGPTWEAMLRDLERVLDVHAPEAAVVVGHSLGGALAQRWALARPERVRALVLSSSFAKLRNPAGNLHARFIEQPLLIASQRLLPAVAARAGSTTHGAATNCSTSCATACATRTPRPCAGRCRSRCGTTPPAGSGRSGRRRWFWSESWRACSRGRHRANWRVAFPAPSCANRRAPAICIR